MESGSESSSLDLNKYVHKKMPPSFGYPLIDFDIEDERGSLWE